MPPHEPHLPNPLPLQALHLKFPTEPVPLQEKHLKFPVPDPWHAEQTAATATLADAMSESAAIMRPRRLMFGLFMFFLFVLLFGYAGSL